MYWKHTVHTKFMSQLCEVLLNPENPVNKMFLFPNFCYKYFSSTEP